MARAGGQRYAGEGSPRLCLKHDPKGIAAAQAHQRVQLAILRIDIKAEASAVAQEGKYEDRGVFDCAQANPEGDGPLQRKLRHRQI